VLIWMWSSDGRVIRFNLLGLMGAMCTGESDLAMVVDSCWIVLVDMLLEDVPCL
jgi:hypothetical protein